MPITAVHSTIPKYDDVLQILVNAGSTGGSLIDAEKFAQPSMTQILLDACADVHSLDDALLQLVMFGFICRRHGDAVRARYVAVARILANAGADVHVNADQIMREVERTRNPTPDGVDPPMCIHRVFVDTPVPVDFALDDVLLARDLGGYATGYAARVPQCARRVRAHARYVRGVAAALPGSAWRVLEFAGYTPASVRWALSLK
jgi:hypothetical protein